MSGFCANCQNVVLVVGWWFGMMWSIPPAARSAGRRLSVSVRLSVPVR